MGEKGFPRSRGSPSEREAFSRVFEHILDAVIGMDSRGLICDWNNQAEEVFGWKRREVAGKRVSDVVMPLRYRRAHEEGLRRFFRTKSGRVINRRAEFVGLRKDGAEFPVELTVTPVLWNREYYFYGFLRDLSARKKAEEAASESYLLLKNILESTFDSVSVKDLDGRYVYINSAGARRFRRNPAEVIGKTDFDWFSRDEASAIRRSDQEVMASGRSLLVDTHDRVEGSPRMIRTAKSPFRDSEGRISGIVGIARDVSEVRTLAEERDRFFEISRDLMCIAGFDGYFKRINSAFERVLGYSRKEILAHPLIYFVHPEERNETLRALARLRNGEPILHFENRYRAKDGSYRWLDWSAQPLGSRIYGSARDVTDRKQFARSLEVSESRFRNLFEEAPVSIQILSPDGRILGVNRAWRELWGISEKVLQEYISKAYNVLTDPQLISTGLAPLIARGLKGERISLPSIQYETGVLEALRDTGRARTVEAFIYPIKDPDGTVREAVLMHRDVTELQLSERTLNLLAETGELLGTSLDQQQTLTRIAEIAVKWLKDCCIIHVVEKSGFEKAAAICADPSKAAAMEELCARISAIDNPLFGPGHVLKTGKASFVRYISPEYRLPEEPPGSDQLATLREFGITSIITMPMSFRGELLGTISIQALGWYYSEQNFSLLRELAHRGALAVQNSKLYSNAQRAIRLRDEFLAVASHELRTPLTALSLQIQTILRGLERGHEEKVRSMLPMIQRSARQLRGLSDFIEGLLDVSRFVGGQLSLRLERFNLVELVRDVVDKMSERPENIGYTIAIEAPQEIVGEWDRFRLEQVITNLVSNAMKYGMGRPLEVRVTNDGKAAALSVRDRGIGISKEDQARIFERFERAVPGARFSGLGLGLYITKEIAALHGGEVTVQSAPGEGSVFTVRLPVRAKEGKLAA